MQIQEFPRLINSTLFWQYVILQTVLVPKQPILFERRVSQLKLGKLKNSQKNVIFGKKMHFSPQKINFHFFA